MQKMMELFSEMKEHGYDTYDKDLTGKTFWVGYLVDRTTLVQTLEKVMPMAYKYGLLTEKYYEEFMYPEKAPKVAIVKQNSESYLDMAEVLYVAKKLADTKDKLRFAFRKKEKSESSSIGKEIH
jgi:hypothetical protein